MKSVTSSVARNYRLQEWAAQIRECQNRLPGTSVKEWCGQHDVTVANYYYRLREVRKACLQNIPEESSAQSIVPVEYYGAAEPPVRCGESHLSGLTEPPHFFIKWSMVRKARSLLFANARRAILNKLVPFMFKSL